MAAGAALALGGLGCAKQQELKVGDVAPSFSLVGSDGKTYDSASLRGRFVVLAWFPKANTGG